MTRTSQARELLRRSTGPSAPAGRIRQPGLRFLRDVDRVLGKPVEIHCLGGFVLTALWNLPRPAGDVDFMQVRPRAAAARLLSLGGEGTTLARTHRVQFQRVTSVECPEGYAARLVDITPRGFANLTLKALEVHDLVLAKLARNSTRDRADVQHLARLGALDRRLLEQRFRNELRANLHNETRESLRFDLWLRDYFPDEEPGVT